MLGQSTGGVRGRGLLGNSELPLVGRINSPLSWVFNLSPITNQENIEFFIPLCSLVFNFRLKSYDFKLVFGFWWRGGFCCKESRMDLFAGGAVGTLFTVLYEVVKDVKEKTMMFKSLLGDLKSTLDSLKPLIEDIEKYNNLMDRPKEELENFKEKMKNGAVLVPKCSTVSRWNTYKKYKYAKKLLDLDQCLNRLLTILNVGGVRDGKETLYRVINIEEKIDKLQIKEEVVLPKKLDIKAWCAVPELPPVTVGLDEPLRDLKKKLLKDDVSTLVLTAHGGSGKTTLATKFCHDKEVKGMIAFSVLFVPSIGKQ